MINKRIKFISYMYDMHNLKYDNKKPFKASINSFYRIKKINGKRVLICPGINNYYNKNAELLDICLWYFINKFAIKHIYRSIDKNTIIVGSIYNFYQDPSLLKFCDNRLIFVQHGGSFGEYKLNLLEEFERDNSTNYLLWNFGDINGVEQTRYGVLHKIYCYVKTIITGSKRKIRYIFSAPANDFKIISGPRDFERLHINNFRASCSYHFHPKSLKQSTLKNIYNGKSLNYINKNDTIILDGPGHTIFYYCLYLKIKVKIYYSDCYNQYLTESFINNFEIKNNFMIPLKKNHSKFSLYNKLCKII